jgi:GNAT superfamily N-acetyltransferase
MGHSERASCRSSSLTGDMRPTAVLALRDEIDLRADLLLRDATSNDALAVADVLIQSRAEYLPFAPSAHLPGDVRAWVASQLLPAGSVTVAENQGELVGVLATSRLDGASWIDHMYVRPGWVDRGVGRQLLEHAHRLLPRPIRLYTFQANAGARRFYERHGYRAIEFTDGQANEERFPDVMYELR